MKLSDLRFAHTAIREKARQWMPAEALLPGLVLASYWLGGEIGLICAALVLPVAVIAGRWRKRALAGAPVPWSAGTIPLPTLLNAVDKHIFDQRLTGQRTACFAIAPDTSEALAKRYGTATSEALLEALATRLSASARRSDHCAVLHKQSQIVLALTPGRALDLEAAIQFSARLQNEAQKPFEINGNTLHISCSIGFALSDKSREANAEDLLKSAQTALRVSLDAGASSIRAYSKEMDRMGCAAPHLAPQIEMALENDEIRPFFQPQISSDTGKVIGFEALARWQHPSRGLISPARFLPLIERSGANQRLTSVILSHSLKALEAWDRAGLDIATVGINFSASDLRDPHLADALQWEFDRHGLSPRRLAVEVLETVLLDPDEESIPRTINTLAGLGCKIDLDDFGTGTASIAAIRRFSVNRLKIDRSFVARADRDTGQQKLLAAILSMAEQLNLRTIGEGVETAGEHATLAQLGCHAVQGYGIARPMAFEHTVEWVRAHETRLSQTPSISSQTR